LKNSRVQEAYEFVQQLNRKKVKSVQDLNMIAQVCSRAENYEEAKEINLLIYERTSSRRALAQLVELSIKQGQPDDAEYYLRLADACAFTDITISGIPAEELTPEGICRFADRIAPFHRQLMAEGRTLTFHPRWQELSDVEGRSVLARLMEASDPALRVLPDVNHIVRAGLDAPAFVTSLAGRISMLHAKDMTDENREKSHLTPVGQGCVDWAPILAAAGKAGVEYVFAEQESWDKDAFSCMKESREYLCGIIGG